MPRGPRVKNAYAIYHITSRSISETLLFIDNTDKDYYLTLLKKYLEKYRCSLYAYCLMSNHVHLHLDTKGFDISTFMHSLNTAYVRYFNKKYNRHGHLFQDRFSSRILYDEAYNLAVSAYIHNNPKDITEYAGHEEDYRYSSYGIYLGIMNDNYDIIDRSFIMGLFNCDSNCSFTKRYHEFVLLRKNVTDISLTSGVSVASAPSDMLSVLDQSSSVSSDLSNISGASDSLDTPDIFPESDRCEYVSGRTVILRDKIASDVISYISEKLEVLHQTSLGLKSSRKLIKYRAFIAYTLRVLCNLNYREICKYMVNITVSSCSRLCQKGYEIVSDDKLHLQLFNELISSTT